MCGKEAIGVSVGDIGTWTYTMAECRVLKIGKKYERKTEFCVTMEIRDVIAIVYRWIK